MRQVVLLCANAASRPGRSPARWMLRCLGVLLTTASMSGVVRPSCAAEPSASLKPVNLNVGFIRTCFLGVNRPDAEAAFKVLAESVGRRRGYQVLTQTQIFDTGPQIEAAVKEGRVNLVIVDSWKYLKLDLGANMKPWFVTAENGKIGKKYLLLARRDGGQKTLADFRGLEILELEVANSNAGQAWLDTLVLANHADAPTTFFRSISLVGKPSAAILPVFFGKKPVCLVDHLSFDLMCELNPQVGKDLQVVAGSESFVDNVVCLSETGWPTEKIKTDIIETLGTLHLEPAGQQILTLFKVGQMIAYQDAALDTVKTLRATHEQLRNTGKSL